MKTHRPIVPLRSRSILLAVGTAFLHLVGGVVAAPPEAPTNLTLEAPVYREVILSWEDNATDEESYRIEVRVPPATAWNFVISADPDTTILPLFGGSPATPVEFRVVAVKGMEESASNIAAATNPDAFTTARRAHIRPAEPFNFTAIANNDSGATSIVYSATGLPTGLSIDPGSGVISGSATEDGLFDAILIATYESPVAPQARDRFRLRIAPVPAPPILESLIASTPLIALSPATNTPLDSHFVDPDTSVAVSIDTTEGTMVFSLFDRAMPDPVANFLIYVDAGSYTNNVFHRSVNAEFFDISQSGGFAGDSTKLTSVATTPPTPPITNAPGIPNDRGTLAYARTSDPDSATSGWYINAQDSPGLDNGDSYAVFGRATTASLTAIDTIHAFPTIPKPADNDPAPPQATTFLSMKGQSSSTTSPPPMATLRTPTRATSSPSTKSSAFRP